MIPGIVGVVEHWEDGAFEDIISNIECPTREIRSAGSPEMIEDSVVRPLCSVFPTVDKRRRYFTASENYVRGNIGPTAEAQALTAGQSR